MLSLGELAAAFGVATAVGGAAGADRLCEMCVEELGVDGAALSLLHRGVSRGTLGSSSTLGRQLDELQFTLGEGPCLDAVTWSQPVMAADLQRAEETRWPAFVHALLTLGVRAVFALPVSIDNVNVGALDLFRNTAGPLTEAQFSGGLLAAEAAELPLLQLINRTIADEAKGEAADWADPGTLARVEVYQATGMIMGRLDIGPEEALVRLRGHAFAHNMTASEVAWDIVERRLVLDNDDDQLSGRENGSSG